VFCQGLKGAFWPINIGVLERICLRFLLQKTHQKTAGLGAVFCFDLR
jgi:hypothetical protein